MIKCLPGFNGERPDPICGVTHLGNGYRAYHPLLMRFTCPDDLSPFGAGGINPYAYCVGDPINRADPSGHVSAGSLFGILAGVIGGVMLGVFTAGLALPATLAIDAAFTVAVTGAAMGIDHQRLSSMSGEDWGVLIGGSVLASVGGAIAGKVLGSLKGARGRPFGGLMMEDSARESVGQFCHPRFLGIYPAEGSEESHMAMSFIDRFNGYDRLNFVGPASMNARGTIVAMGSGEWNGRGYRRTSFGAWWLKNLAKDAVTENPEIRTVRLAVPYAGQSFANAGSLRAQVQGYLRREGVLVDVTAPRREFTVHGPVADILTDIVSGLHFDPLRGLVIAQGQLYEPAAAQESLNLISENFANSPNAFVINFDPR